MQKLSSPSSCLKLVASGVHTEERLRSVQDRCWAVCWHHSGRLLASCGEDRTVKVWRCDVADDEARLVMVCPLRGDQTRSVRSVAFSPCGRFLASASFDASIVVYERQPAEGGDGDGVVVEFEEVHRLEGHENEVKCVTFSRSGEQLATCSRDKSVWVWQIDGDGDYEVASILQNHTADVKFVVWHPRVELLLSGGYDGSIRFYTFDGDEWSTAQAIKDAHDETVWSAAFEPSIGNHLATVGSDKSIRIWKCTTPNVMDEQSWQKMAEHTVLDTRWPLYTVAWSAPTESSSATNGIIAVGGGDCSLRLFVLDAELEVLILLGAVRMDSEVNCVAWRPATSSDKKNRQSQQQQSQQHLPNDNENDEDSANCSATPIAHPHIAVALDSGEVLLLKLQ